MCCVLGYLFDTPKLRLILVGWVLGWAGFCDLFVWVIVVVGVLWYVTLAVLRLGLEFCWVASDWLVCYDVGFGGLGWFVGLLVVAVILGCCWGRSCGGGFPVWCWFVLCWSLWACWFA